MPRQTCGKRMWEGGQTPFLTNAFLDQTRNNLENLSDTKVLLCDQRLSQKLGARQKRAARAKPQKIDFWSN